MFQVQYIDPLKKRRYADLAMNFPDAEGAYRIGVSTIGFFIYSRARCNARMSNSSSRRLLSTGSVPMLEMSFHPCANLDAPTLSSTAMY
jgi:methylphosphotriester-DNA--protein-cysteine methyltransferase